MNEQYKELWDDVVLNLIQRGKTAKEATDEANVVVRAKTEAFKPKSLDE